MSNSFLFNKDRHVRVPDSQIEAAVYVMHHIAIRREFDSEEVLQILSDWLRRVQDAAPGCMLFDLEKLSINQRKKMADFALVAMSTIEGTFGSEIPKSMLNEYCGVKPGQREVYAGDLPIDYPLHAMQSFLEVLAY